MLAGPSETFVFSYESTRRHTLDDNAYQNVIHFICSAITGRNANSVERKPTILPFSGFKHVSMLVDKTNGMPCFEGYM